jgi:hypothetical protein
MRRMTSSIVKPKTFFPSKDSDQPVRFLLHKEEIASYTVFVVVFIASRELFWYLT